MKSDLRRLKVLLNDVDNVKDEAKSNPSGNRIVKRLKNQVSIKLLLTSQPSPGAAREKFYELM